MAVKKKTMRRRSVRRNVRKSVRRSSKRNIRRNVRKSMRRSSKRNIRKINRKNVKRNVRGSIKRNVRKSSRRKVMLGGMSHLFRRRWNNKNLAKQALKEVECMNNCSDVVNKNTKIKISNLQSDLNRAKALEKRSEQKLRDAIIRNRLLVNDLAELRQGQVDANLSNTLESHVLMARQAPIIGARGEEAEVVGVVDTSPVSTLMDN